jgi:hypothetical protein
VIISFHAINALGFMEPNPLAVGFPIWIFVLKFGSCLILMVCVYVLHKFGMENYLLLPLGAPLILIEFYAFAVAFNVTNILGV